MSDPSMNLSRILACAIALLALSGQAEAQFPKGPPKGKPPAPKSPTGGSPPLNKWKVLDHRYDPEQGTSGQDKKIRAGDRVVGRISAGAMHHVRFEGVTGGKVTIKLVAKNSRLALSARLRDPRANVVATLDPKGRPGSYVLTGYELPSSGLYTIELAAAKSEINTYELSTTMELPSTVSEVVSFEGGRPAVYEFGGVTGRTLDSMRLWTSRSDDGVHYVARLTDPDGIDVDLTPYLRGAAGGKSLHLSRVPLEILGTYRLTIADRSRGSAKAKLQLRFDNPPAGRELHRL